MNQIAIETTTIETETDLQVTFERQVEDAVIELNSSQLALIGGGAGSIIL